MPSDQQRRPPLLQLTGLRFFAAISVAIAHAAAISLRIDPASNLVIVRHWMESLATFGMSLFFILSGFVIHYNYADRLASFGIRGVCEFLWARFSRLYPLYFFVLIIELLSSNLITSYIRIGSVAERVEAIPAYIMLIQSWGYKVIGERSLIYAFGSVVPVTWSISTEWFFYLCYPAMLPLVVRLRSLRSCLVALLVWSLAWGGTMLAMSDLSVGWNLFAIKAYGNIATTGNDDSFVRWALYFSPYARIGEFILGALLSNFISALNGTPLTNFERRFGRVLSLVSVSIVISVLYLMYDIGGTSWIRKLSTNFGLAVPVALLIFCALRYQTFVSWICTRAWILFLGEASYSIYLIHFYIYMPFMSRAAEPLPAGFGSSAFLLARLIAMVALVLLAATATYRCVELPSRQYLRRLQFGFVSKQFGSMAALALGGLMMITWFAVFVPVTTTSGQSDDAIIVAQATYGRNCGASEGNAIRHVAKFCNGKTRCNYVVDVQNFGDPAAGCGKDFTVEFNCGSAMSRHRVELPGEAGLGSVAVLSCVP